MQNKVNTIVMVPIEQIIPNDKNNNKHTEEQKKRAHKIFDAQGFRQPLLISNRSGKLIAGHLRLEVAKEKGAKELPCMYQDFDSEEQEYQHLTADNALAVWAELDLAQIQTDLRDLGDFDLDLLGIDDFELPEIKELDEANEDTIPGQVDTRAKLGDIWQLGEHRLMCGDSTSIDAVEKLMNGEKADMVFTDPPYGVDYKGINNDSRDGLEELLSSAFSNYFLTSKSGASIYVFHSDKCADIFHKCFREHFHFSSMIIWNKNSLTLSRTDYQSKHEPCLYGWMKSGTHSFYGDRKRTSVWDIFKERVEGHTTPKPIEVIEKALSNSSKSGDLVTDLFGGSGSTLIACEKTNRKCFMSELDPHYVDVILARWEKYTGKTATRLESNNETTES